MPQQGFTKSLTRLMSIQMVKPIQQLQCLLVKMQDNASFDILMTQSFSPLEQTLVATKVDVENRSVIEFNDRPAAEEYARSLGISGVDELPKYFLSHPVGLVINDRKVLIRTPVSISGTSIKFSSSILKDMEVTLLESGDIIERTREAVDQRLQESDGKTVGILSVECGYRRDELEEKNLTEQYGKIFSTIPNVGFDSHGEAYIGHMSQSAIMVFFKYDANLPGKQDMSIFSAAEGEKNRLSQINRDLELENMELRRKLDITATELKRCNVSLVEEMNYRTEREEMIRQMSYHDELTNLYNRRYFVDHLSTLDVEENLPLPLSTAMSIILKLQTTHLADKGDKLLRRPQPQ